jgi:hypothetical protein
MECDIPSSAVLPASLRRLAVAVRGVLPQNTLEHLTNLYTLSVENLTNRCRLPILPQLRKLVMYGFTARTCSLIYNIDAMTMLQSLQLEGNFESSSIPWERFTHLRSLMVTTNEKYLGKLPCNLVKLTVRAECIVNGHTSISHLTCLQKLTLLSLHGKVFEKTLALQPSVAALVCTDDIFTGRVVVSDHLQYLRLTDVRRYDCLRDYSSVNKLKYLCLMVYRVELAKIKFLLDNLRIAPSVRHVRIRSPGFSTGHESCLYKDWESSHPDAELMIFYENIGNQIAPGDCPYCM